MILACPACATRYRVDEREFGGLAGRIVRCANCGHAWHYPAEKPGTAVGAGVAPSARAGSAGASATAARVDEGPRLEIPPRPPSAAPAGGRRGGPVRRWALVALAIVMVALAILAGIAARRYLAAIWPSLQRFSVARVLPPAAADRARLRGSRPRLDA